jgi:hypothetical protein
MRSLGVLIGLALVVTGCSTVDSADIKTSGMTADLLVKLPENADAVDVTASFRVGNLTYVELGSGENVEVSADGKREQLHRGKFAGATSYTGQLGVSKGSKISQVEINFALNRAGGNTSAPSSTVVLPEPVHLSQPFGGAKLSRRKDVQVSFASGPAQTLTWSGPCIQTGSLQIEPGRSSTTIAAGLIRATMPATPNSAGSDTCQVDFLLSRHTTGRIDGAFKDGTIVAVAQSIHQVVSAP